MSLKSERGGKGLNISGFLRTMDSFNEDCQASSYLHWNRKEKIMWLCTLMAGTTMLYSARTTAPLVAPAMSEELKWSKTDVGTVLSSFFWGYALTQILGGYLSDRFGAEKILLGSGAGWALITFWFHRIVYLASNKSSAFSLIILFRVLLGACQGVHFPSMASLTSKNLNSRDRGLFFSVATGGSAVGALVTGSLGSYVNTRFGWPSVFYTIGFFSLAWVAVLRFYAIELSRTKKKVIDLDVSSCTPLMGNGNPNGGVENRVPWLVYLKAPSLWACTFCHFCQNNCFFILLSWLPTYFHDNFPGEPSWVFNLVPWTVMIPGLLTAAFISNKLVTKGFSVTHMRKILESTCMVTEAICLVLIGYTAHFKMALTWTMVAIFAKNFHNFGVSANPLDIAPKHSGSILGISNTFSAMSGFIGVYLAGYILELTGSWQAVFNVTAAINFMGIFVFILFGSGNPII